MIIKNGKVEFSVRVILKVGITSVLTIERPDIALVPNNVLGFQFQTLVSAEAELDNKTLPLRSNSNDALSNWYYVDAKIITLPENPGEVEHDGAPAVAKVQLSNGEFVPHSLDDQFVSRDALGPFNTDLDLTSNVRGALQVLVVAFSERSQR